MRRNLVHILLILAVTSAIVFVNLGQARLWDRDEPRNAGCAAEMLARGDLVTPMFNDELRHQKPVLLYWLIISAYAMFGQTEFAARFWSAILSIGSVLATYAIARRLINPAVALLSGLILATSLMFDVASRAATPDAILIFCGTLAMMVYVLGTFAVKKQPTDAPQLRTGGEFFPRHRAVVCAIYAAMSVGVLAKGPVAMVVPGCIIGLFMLIQRCPPLDAKWSDKQGRILVTALRIARPFQPMHVLRTFWSMRPLLALAMLCAIAAPWYIWVGIRTDGDWLKMFFLDEHFGRATTVLESHDGGWWYYPAAILLGFFPWSVWLAPTLIGIDRRLSQRAPDRIAIVFALCWVAVQVGLFTLAKTKLPNYVTPCYPALAILTAAYLVSVAQNNSWVPGIWTPLGFLGLAVAGGVAAIGLGVAGEKLLAAQWYLGLAGLPPLVGGLAGYVLFSRGRAAHSIAVMCATAIVLALGVFGWLTLAVDKSQQNQIVLDIIRDSQQDTPVAAYRCLESSWVYYGGRPIYELSTDGVDANATVPARQRPWNPKPRVNPESFVRQHPDALFITTGDRVGELLLRLPSGYSVRSEAPYFLRAGKQIVLLGRGSGPSAQAERDASLGWR